MSFESMPVDRPTIQSLSGMSPQQFKAHRISKGFTPVRDKLPRDCCKGCGKKASLYENKPAGTPHRELLCCSCVVDLYPPAPKR